MHVFRKLILLLFCTSVSQSSLACPHLNFKFANEYDYQFMRDAAAYMLSSFLDNSSDIEDDGIFFQIPCSGLSPSQMHELKAIAIPGSLSFKDLRDLTTTYYNSNRDKHHWFYKVPATLKDFKILYPFHTAPIQFRVKNSKAKEADRLIFRMPELSVAQTVGVKEDGREYIRETEVIIKREHDEHMDFYVYDIKGNLSSQSEFRQGIMADSPYVCMACHYNTNTRLFSLETGFFNP